MSDLEKVARALCVAAGENPDVLIQARHEKVPNWFKYKTAARAAVEALREPSEGMLKAAFVAMNETPSGTWKRMKEEGSTPRRLFDVKMAPRWRAMVNHILKEG